MLKRGTAPFGWESLSAMDKASLLLQGLFATAESVLG